MRLALAIVLSSLLTGCVDVYTQVSSFQIAGQTEPYPSDYRQQALRSVTALAGKDPRTLEISAPRTVAGVNPLSPKRWYSCVRTRQDLQGTAPYAAIVFLTGSITSPLEKASRDADLCHGGIYEPLVAAGEKLPEF